jgi:hypothetical protein
MLFRLLACEARDLQPDFKFKLCVRESSMCCRSASGGVPYPCQDVGRSETQGALRDGPDKQVAGGLQVGLVSLPQPQCMARQASCPEKHAEPFSVPGRSRDIDLVIRQDIKHPLRHLVVRGPMTNEIGSADLVERFCLGVPVGPFRGRSDEVRFRSSVLEHPGDLDRVAGLGEGRGLEIEEDTHQPPSRAFSREVDPAHVKKMRSLAADSVGTEAAPAGLPHGRLPRREPVQDHPRYDLVVTVEMVASAALAAAAKRALSSGTTRDWVPLAASMKLRAVALGSAAVTRVQ